MMVTVNSLFVLLCCFQTTASESNSMLSSESLRAAAEYSQSYRGQAMLVLFDGKIVFEQYANGGAANTRHILASGSKSFVGVPFLSCC